MTFFVYILCSKSRNALYVGATRDLRRRVEQHRAGIVGSHTRKYRIRQLIYFETHETARAALERERRIKRWRRDWKEELIASVNPDWRDISMGIPL